MVYIGLLWFITQMINDLDDNTGYPYSEKPPHRGGLLRPGSYHYALGLVRKAPQKYTAAQLTFMGFSGKDPVRSVLLGHETFWGKPLFQQVAEGWRSTENRERKGVMAAVVKNTDEPVVLSAAKRFTLKPRTSLPNPNLSKLCHVFFFHSLNYLSQMCLLECFWRWFE